MSALTQRKPNIPSTNAARPGVKRLAPNSTIAVAQANPTSATASPSAAAPAADFTPAAAGASAHAHGSDSAVSVAVRIRPLNRYEVERHSTEVWKVLGDTCVVSQLQPEGDSPEARQREDSAWAFDRAFGPETSTLALYEAIAEPVVSSAMAGINGTIFAYGQTASGKTHTMQGTEQDPGILRLCAKQLFEDAQSTPQVDYTFVCNYVELYNETVKDLLSSATGPLALQAANDLKIREDRSAGFYVEGVTELQVHSYEELLATFVRGESRRHVAGTDMNEKSSRSHTIFAVNVTAKEKPSESGHMAFGLLRGRLSLVDLAGSESVRSTNAEGERLKEGGKINTSLLTLSRVISSLASKRPGGAAPAHVNFRDSKLTQILQPSLAGNCRTAIVCCVTPASHFTAETLSTLKFASSAKKIRTQVVVNQIADVTRNIRSYQDQVENLQHTLARERAALKAVQEELQVFRAQGDAAATAHALNRAQALETELQAAGARIATLQKDLAGERLAREEVCESEMALAESDRVHVMQLAEAQALALSTAEAHAARVAQLQDMLSQEQAAKAAQVAHLEQALVSQVAQLQDLLHQEQAAKAGLVGQMERESLAFARRLEEQLGMHHSALADAHAARAVEAQRLHDEHQRVAQELEARQQALKLALVRTQTDGTEELARCQAQLDQAREELAQLRTSARSDANAQEEQHAHAMQQAAAELQARVQTAEAQAAQVVAGLEALLARARQEHAAFADAVAQAQDEVQQRLGAEHQRAQDLQARVDAALQDCDATRRAKATTEQALAMAEALLAETREAAAIASTNASALRAALAEADQAHAKELRDQERAWQRRVDEADAHVAAAEALALDKSGQAERAEQAMSAAMAQTSEQTQEQHRLHEQALAQAQGRAAAVQLELCSAEAERAAVAKERDELLQAVQARSAAVQAAEQRLADCARDLAEVRHQQAQAQADWAAEQARGASAAEDLQAQLQQAQAGMAEAAAEWARRCRELDADKQALGEEVLAAREEAVAVQQANGELAARADQAEARLRVAEQQREDAQSELSWAQSGVQDAEAKLRDVQESLTVSRDALDRQAKDAAEALDSARRVREALEDELVALQARAARQEQDLSQQVDALREQWQAAAREHVAAEERAKDAEARLLALQTDFDASRRARAAAEAAIEEAAQDAERLRDRVQKLEKVKLTEKEAQRIKELRQKYDELKVQAAQRGPPPPDSLYELNKRVAAAEQARAQALRAAEQAKELAEDKVRQLGEQHKENVRFLEKENLDLMWELRKRDKAGGAPSDAAAPVPSSSSLAGGFADRAEAEAECKQQ